MFPVVVFTHQTAHHNTTRRAPSCPCQRANKRHLSRASHADACAALPELPMLRSLDSCAQLFPRGPTRKNIFASTRLRVIAAIPLKARGALLGGTSARCRFEIMALFTPQFKKVLVHSERRISPILSMTRRAEEMFVSIGPIV